MARRRREVPTPELRCPTCRAELERFWAYCPDCGRRLEWRDTARLTGAECYYCRWVVSDSFSFCPWCGEDATGSNLIRQALRCVRQLLIVSRLRDWHYRVLLRPGVSGVTHRTPKVIEIERRYVTGKRSRDEISWNMLTGLILHELGHSFLYHNWSFTRTGRFRRAFGEVRKMYRVADSKWVDFERRGVTTTLPNYVTAYAATHPQEDFAETFRFYVARRGRLRELFAEFGRKRKGVPVFEKFLVLGDFIRSLRGGSERRRS